MADTIGDLIANIIGIIIALLVIRYQTKKLPAGATIGSLFFGKKDRS
jgi:glycopeptide antibiotics resistance protein